MKNWMVCAALLGAASSVNAETYGFTRHTNDNATSATAGETQLRMTVTADGAARVNFHFYWVGSVPMSVCDIYFDDAGNPGPGVLGTFGDSNIVESTGVAYSVGASPPSLPGGGNFVTSSGLSADSDSPVEANGINHSTEFLNISIALYGSHTFADVIAQINQGFVSTSQRGLRVGLHVQAIGQGYQGAGGSEAFINNTQQIVLVPLPPAAWAGLGSFSLVLGAARVRRRRMKI
jgi:hypothetical protein